MEFYLHPNLSEKTKILDLPLCTVLLEDNSHYPWLILVPRRVDLAKLIDLSPSDQLQQALEINSVQKVLWDLFKPTQLNVAAIGNITPQLHIHVIARFSTDPAWPGTVWDHPDKAPYKPLDKELILNKIVAAFA